MTLRELRRIVTDPELNPGAEWVVSRKNCHIKVTLYGKLIAVLASTPGRGRSIDHSIADLRRGGIIIPRKTDK